MGWGIVYYKTKDGRVPAEEFLEALPAKVAARFDVVLDTVRKAPPPQFSGGGFWEAMHGSMNGYYEIRITGCSTGSSAYSTTRMRKGSSDEASTGRRSR